MRFATFNVLGIDHAWFAVRQAECIAGLRRLNPDIVALQEVGFQRERPSYDQAVAIGEAVELPYVAFAPYGNASEIKAPRQGGVAVLSRWPLRRSRNLNLPPGSPTDARVALLVQIEAPFCHVNVAATHLSWRPQDEAVRLDQMRVLLSEIEALGWFSANISTVLLGDLNAIETEPAIRLARQRFRDGYRERHPHETGYTLVRDNPYTWQFDYTDRRVDYILVDAHAKIEAADLGLTTPPASDHFAVIADLNF